MTDDVYHKEKMFRSEVIYRGKKIVLWEYTSFRTGKNVVYGYFRRVSHKTESWSAGERGEVIRKLKELMDVDERNRVVKKVR